MWGMVIMIYSAEKEAEILNMKMSTFRTRKSLKDFLNKHDIEYNKTILNKTNLHKIKTLGELLYII